MTFVPDPRLVSGARSEVGASVVVYLGGEAEEPSVGGGAGAGGAAGQTVLLLGTLQRVHGPVLQVRGLFHRLGVQNQVRSRYKGAGGKLLNLKPYGFATNLPHIRYTQKLNF